MRNLRRARLSELHLQEALSDGISREEQRPTLIMSSGVRKATFTAHVTKSAGWIGAVLGFLALAVIGLTSQDERTVRGA